MHIERSVNIDASPQDIYKVLSDFNDWRPWSPWLCMEPEVEVNVAADAKSYEWKGKRTGSGNMKITEERENEFIDYDLNFLKPWKSFAKTNFTLTSAGDKTKVTWVMNSSLPFFMFFMKGMMESFVGADYERGLDMLKVYVEEGKVPSDLEFHGVKPQDGISWIGVKTECSLDIVGTQMEADFGMVKSYAADKGIVGSKVMTIYHKWDIPKGKVSYTAAVESESVPDDLPDRFTSGKVPSSECYVIRHTGSYKHLGNAWATLYTMLRNKEIKNRKRTDPFELYLNNPENTPQNELITDVYFPIR